MTENSCRQLYQQIFEAMTKGCPDAVIDRYELQRRARKHAQPAFTEDERAHLVSLIEGLPAPASLDDDGIRDALATFVNDKYEWFYGMEVDGASIGSAASNALRAPCAPD